MTNLTILAENQAELISGGSALITLFKSSYAPTWLTQSNMATNVGVGIGGPGNAGSLQSNIAGILTFVS